MKMHLEIIKGLGLILLLFIMVSAIGVSDSSYEASAKIVQVSTEGDDEEAKTIISTYDKECNDPAGIHVTAEITGSGERTINDKDGVIPAGEDAAPEEDETTAQCPDSVIKPPRFKFGESPEEFNDRVVEWIHQILDEGSLFTIEDFPVDIADIANVE